MEIQKSQKTLEKNQNRIKKNKSWIVFVFCIFSKQKKGFVFFNYFFDFC